MINCHCNGLWYGNRLKTSYSNWGEVRRKNWLRNWKLWMNGSECFSQFNWISSIKAQTRLSIILNQWMNEHYSKMCLRPFVWFEFNWIWIGCWLVFGHVSELDLKVILQTFVSKFKRNETKNEKRSGFQIFKSETNNWFVYLFLLYAIYGPVNVMNWSMLLGAWGVRYIWYFGSQANYSAFYYSKFIEQNEDAVNCYSFNHWRK